MSEGQNSGNNGGPNNSNNSNNNNNSNIINSSGSNQSNNAPIGAVGGLVGGGTSATAAKNQLEQLNTMREALFSQDGWGCQHVNQDTNWEVPSSPEPTNKDPSSGTPLWKPTINNGTDLWESNLRNGGQPPTQPAHKTPWGHTPSSNLGGTWGEDDDGTDGSNVWTGSAPNSAAVGGIGVASASATGGPAGGPGGPGSQWGQGAVGVGVGAGGNAGVGAGNIPGVTSGGGSNSTSANIPGNAVTGGAGGGNGNGWGDPRDLRSGPLGGGMDVRSVDPRDTLRAASAGDPRDLRMIDPRDPIRGDPRGISGRLNGTSEMWQHHPIAHNQMPTMNKMVGPGAGTGPNVAAPVVPGGGVPGMGPGVGAINSSSGLGGNVSAQWGNAQAVVGPKDITAISNKQVTGWEEPSPPPQRRNIPNYDDGTSLWGGQQSRVPGGGSHWKEISDPINRNHLMRNSLGNQNAQNSAIVTGLGNVPGSGLGAGQASVGIGAPGSVGVVGNPSNAMGGVGPQGRLASAIGGPAVGGQHKNENAMWVHQTGGGVVGRTANSWGDDVNHSVGNTTSTNWAEDKSNSGLGQLGSNVGGGNSWNDPSGSWNKNQMKVQGGGGGAGWGTATANDNETGSEWNSHNNLVGKQHQKMNSVNVGVGNMNTEMIKQSKQYRILVDSGFKKEDVERALLNSNMNIEEAAEMLRTNATIVMDGWRRHDDGLCSYADHTNTGTAGFPGRYSGAGAQPMPFPPNNLLNNMGGNSVGVGANNPNMNALNAMQPLQVQKYLNQGPHNMSGGPPPVNTAAVAFGQGGQGVSNAAVSVASNSNNQPSPHQLRMLVQQIQMAVHNGYLSSQILNQPLAPTTLLLLNQLLSNIKHLQGAQQSLSRGNNLQINVAIAKYKQQIQNLQNQINAQQAIYIKQQTLQQTPQQQHPANHLTNTSNEYMRGQHDAISALQGNFSEINLNKSGGAYQSTPNPQSRLNQWKLPVLEKDVVADSTDFSRAPGATKQILNSVNASNMGPLGLQSDGTWSSGRNIGDGWPDPSNDNENKDWSVAQPASATAYTDLVQEFEPGKPWKIKSIEDDPSITPGSVARSPLSINPTPKEADMFANTSKSSPTDLTPLSLTSSTWSFNPSSNSQNFPSWSDNSQQCATSELWANPMNKTSRGPPPGLGNKGAAVSGVSSVPSSASVVSGNTNTWLVNSGRAVSGGSNPGWTGNNATWNSNWLLIKNLTAQIDGSTLRTLCMQHGPLLSFHVYQTQGIALCKYATREEANKAQMTLNNCALGNTTICAESPSENEVQSIMQHLPPTSSSVMPGSNGNGNGSCNTGNSALNMSGVGGNGGNGNGNNSAVNGSGNVGPGGNIPNNVPVSGGVNTQGQSGQSGSSGSNNTVTSNVSSGGPGGNPNNPAGANNSAWRQAQSQQNQSRPIGRETDFDYISKYVCSIVDD